MFRPGLLRTLALLGTGILALGAGCAKEAELPAAQRDALVGHLAEQGESPEDYVTSQFTDHDVVMIGEFNRIKEDVEFVQSLLPRLYEEAGVRVIAIEFASSPDQAVIDTLLGDVLFNAVAAAAVQRRYSGGMWPYLDYLDIYKSAWDINRKRPPGSEPFRVVALSPYVDWEKLNYGSEAESQTERQRLAAYDAHMAEVLEREVLSRGEKALVYCGIRHAFTRFEDPVVREGTFVRFRQGRMGNLLHEKLGERVMTVLLHSPWPAPDRSGLYRACDGTLDLALDAHGAPVGFDVPGSPFGDLGDTRAVYRLGHADFSLAKLCDGYVYQKPLNDLTGVSTISGWIPTPEAFEEAKRKAPMREFAERFDSVSDFMTELRRSAGIPTQFEGVK